MYTSSVLKFNEYTNGKDATSYWLQRNTPIIAKDAAGGYITTSVTFTPMKQVGTNNPQVCSSSDDNITVEIYKNSVESGNKLSINADVNGVYTATLGKEETGKHDISTSLCARMLLGDIKIDEETVEVLAEGVTIGSVEYATSTSGISEPTSGWSTTYPNNIQQGMFLWTKITYSNGQTALSSVYEPKDGTSATAAYTIDLTNDNIFIGTDRNGNRTDWSLLEEISEVVVTVWEGGENITDHCSFSWEVSNGDSSLLSALNEKKSIVCFTSKEDKTIDPIGADSVTAIVTVTKNATETEDEKQLGSKTCSVTKNKQGEPGSNAITYSLAVSPNSWNLDESSSIKPTFVVTKYTGSTPSTISTGYTIKVENNPYDGKRITETTTFDLWIDQVKVDSETVTAVRNGNDSTVPGPRGGDGSNGKTRGTIVLYKASDTEENDKPKAPIKPTATIPDGNGTLNGWQITAPDPREGLRFVWKTNGTYTEDINESNRVYDDNWTAPELHSAHIASNVSGSAAAEYYKLFGTGETNQGMKYNDDGKLYINASMINTGILTITKNGGEASESNKTLFSAGWDSNGKGSVYINGMTVGEIASKNDVTVGRNLAKKSAISAYNGTLQERDYQYTVVKSSANAGVRLSENIFTKNKKYVISYKISITDANATNSIAGHCSGFTINKAVIDDKEPTSGDYNNGYPFENKEVGVTHSVVLYVTFNGDKTDNGFYIQPERGTSDCDIREYVVWDLKVEEGEVHSSWIVPYEDQLAPSVQGSYSWQFSQSDGIKMWNGNQNGNPIFKVDAGGLYIKGKIEADSGYIGGWKITENGFTKTGNKQGINLNYKDGLLDIYTVDPNSNEIVLSAYYRGNRAQFNSTGNRRIVVDCDGIYYYNNTTPVSGITFQDFEVLHNLAQEILKQQSTGS